MQEQTYTAVGLQFIPMPPFWDIFYARWMIDDGLPELSIGESREWFAIWFHSNKNLERVHSTLKIVVPVEKFRYSIKAEVVFLHTDQCVIDFGLRAIGSAKVIPQGVAVGDFIEGEIEIGFEHSISVIPGDILKTLSNKWTIKNVFAEIGGEGKSPNSTLPQYQDIPSTTSFSADTM